MAKRHIIMLIIVLACFILLGWEVYQLISADNVSLTQKLLHTVTPQNVTTPQVKQHVGPYVKNNHPVLVKNQKQYIDLVNKIELAKMQRRLMDEEVAIAADKNRIAILNAQTNKLIEPIPTINAKQHPAPIPVTHCHTPHINKKIVPPPTAKKKIAPPMLAQTTVTTPRKLPASEFYTLDEILLLDLPANNYTIFLKGSFNKHELDMLAKEKQLGPKAIYYSILKKGQPWFILLYDHYNTKAEAQNTLQQLPETLQQLNPHIEGIATIQVAIKTQFGIHVVLR